MRDALDQVSPRLDVESVASTNGYAAPIRADLFARSHEGSNHVISLESAGTLAADHVSAGEAMPRQSGALVAAPPGGLDDQYRLLPMFDAIDLSYTSGV